MNLSSAIWLVFSVLSCRGKVGPLWSMNKLVSAAINSGVIHCPTAKGLPLFIYITQFCHLTQYFMHILVHVKSHPFPELHCGNNGRK